MPAASPAANKTAAAKARARGRARLGCVRKALALGVMESLEGAWSPLSYGHAHDCLSRVLALPAAPRRSHPADGLHGLRRTTVRSLRSIRSGGPGAARVGGQERRRCP